MSGMVENVGVAVGVLSPAQHKCPSFAGWSNVTFTVDLQGVNQFLISATSEASP